MPIRNFAQIDKAREQLEIIEAEFLEQRGWKLTCDTPGSLWLWTKTLPDGRVALVEMATAIMFEGHQPTD